MTTFKLPRNLFLAGVTSAILALPADSEAIMVQVTVTNNAPTGGNYITPVWLGFHDGTFDAIEAGSAASTGIERIAEDGAVGDLQAAFAGSGVDGVLGGAPIAPGASVTLTVDIDTAGANRYFSLASMVLPTNDIFISNDNPLAYDLSSLVSLGNTASFDVGRIGVGIFDAGTEVNDPDFAAGVPLFPGFNGDVGQGGPNQGADENGVVTLVAADSDPYAGVTGAGAALDFTSAANNPNGLATIGFTVVPEPGVGAMSALGLLFLFGRRTRR